MKRTNVIGLIAALLIAAAIISLISWVLIRPIPTIIQGEVDATSYKASSKIAGRIDTMLVTPGQKVAKGELLYVLGTPEIDAKLRQAKAAQSAASAQDRKAIAGARVQQIDGALSLLQQAEAGLQLAQKTFDRVSNLYAQGVVPAQKYDEAEANYKAMKATAAAAKSQYDMAVAGTRKEDKAAAAALVEQASSVVSEVEIYLDDARVYSPIDGEVATIIAEQGELVGSGYPVVTIVDMSDQWVSLNIKETLLPKIKIGTRFMADMPALGRSIELVVEYIAVQADFATWSATRTSGGFDIRTFNVKARPVSAEPDLRPGMSAVANWDEIK